MSSTLVGQKELGDDLLLESSVSFLGSETGLKPTETKACFDYIGEKVVPRLLELELLPTYQKRYLSKNSRIKDYVAELCDLFCSRKECIVLYSFGVHIQKALTIVEIFKKALKEGPADANSANEVFEQYNKLSRFVSVVPGRNELLERKMSVPILVIVIAHPKTVEGLTGFFRQ